MKLLALGAFASQALAVAATARCLGVSSRGLYLQLENGPVIYLTHQPGDR